MVRLTCLLRRKEGLSPAEFHAYWRDHHGPFVVGTRSGSHVLRYEQHPRPLDDYRGDDDRRGYDGVTVQWFASMDAYRAHTAEPDFSEVFDDLGHFLDVDHLEFVVTEEPRVVLDGPDDLRR
jgi:hypothetical protein